MNLEEQGVKVSPIDALIDEQAIPEPIKAEFKQLYVKKK